MEQLKIKIILYFENYRRTGNIEYWHKGFQALNQLAKYY